MKKEFTPRDIFSKRGCYTINEVRKLSFIKKEIIKVEDVLNSEISLSDKLYFIINNCDPEPEDCYSHYSFACLRLTILIRDYLGVKGSIYPALSRLEDENKKEIILNTIKDFVNKN